MNPEELQKSVVLITSADSNINRFGTGFIVRRANGASYVLTCAHVLKDVKSTEGIKVEGMMATVVASGENDGLDLAVLRVYGLWSKPELALKASGKKESPFVTAGFQLFDKAHLIRSLRGTLGEPIGLQSTRLGERVQAWDLCILDDYFLQPGYSGSPVVDETSGCVLGIVTHRQGEGKRGLAISIESLKKIWKFIDIEQLYKSLLKLGYSRQVRLFRQLVKEYSVAALLIYGPPIHGQRWLLNLLLIKHLPFITASRVVKVGLNRSGRRIDAKALWRELSRSFELPANSSVEEIIQRVYKCWQTQNIILIFHEVNWLPKESLKELIHNFWLPLAKEIQNSSSTFIKSKLLMFLVDYEGSVGSLEDFFAGQMNSEGQSYTPVKAPKIDQFSEDELLNWLESEGDELPAELVEEVDSSVKEILMSSDGGVPELTLEEICARCGCNWYEESEKWLKY
ncbi:MAG: trypsin-like peptidase domain-containing protein [Aulosira sp. DedQUE10]|nr:trypsin-like peptidase domain-containing protein [Aulosira sp. DedQUE10]